MPKPKMVIGTDRMELYDFLAKRKRVLTERNRIAFRLMVGATLAHAALV
jgi:hypothetical protein